MSFNEYMQAGGAIMWLILAMSVLALALVIERILFFLSASTNPQKLELAFGEAIAQDDREKVGEVVGGKSSMHRMFRCACAHWQIDAENLKLLLEGQIRRELYRWEKRLPTLDIIAKTAPLLGLLGTVLGMVEMFQSMSLGGAVNSQAITGGIWKALFTTVAGLTVAIPVIFAHGVLSGMIDKEEETLKRASDFVIMEHYNYHSRQGEKARP